MFQVLKYHTLHVPGVYSLIVCYYSTKESITAASNKLHFTFLGLLTAESA